MPKNVSKIVVLLAALVLVGAGCASGGDESSPSTSRSGILGGGSGCDHPYYPLQNGYSITYKTNVGGETDSYTVRVIEERGDTIKMRYDFDDDLFVEQQIKCSGGVVEALGYVDLGSAISRGEIHTETRSTGGVLLPENMRVGSSWTTSYEISIAFDDPSMAAAGIGSMDSNVTIDRTVVGEESVTVPAGTYTALKVEGVTTIEAQIVSGFAIPPTEISSTEYWVRNVGMVKSVSSGIGESSIQATSVTVP